VRSAVAFFFESQVSPDHCRFIESGKGHQEEGASFIMLAQNFKTADELEITESEQQALIKVLGMLERGELIDAKQEERCENGFCIGTQGRGCGTPACIGGWAALLMVRHQREYVNSYMTRYHHQLGKLYWEYPDNVTTVEAAHALRSYLTTGDARWDLATA
jgi:hypothetical protein